MSDITEYGSNQKMYIREPFEGNVLGMNRSLVLNLSVFKTGVIDDPAVIITKCANFKSD